MTMKSPLFTAYRWGDSACQIDMLSKWILMMGFCQESMTNLKHLSTAVA